MTNIENHNLSACRRYETAEHSTLNRTSIYPTLSSQDLKITEEEGKGILAESNEVYKETIC